MEGPPQPNPDPGGKGGVAPRCEAGASLGGSAAPPKGRPVGDRRATPGKECGGPQPAPLKGVSGGWNGIPGRYAKLGSDWGGKGGMASLVGLNLGAWLEGLLAGGLKNLGGLLAGGGGLVPVASGASGLKAGAPTRNEGMSQMLSPSGVSGGGLNEDGVFVPQPPMRAGSAEGAAHRPADELAERDLCSWERGLVKDSSACCCCCGCGCGCGCDCGCGCCFPPRSASKPGRPGKPGRGGRVETPPKLRLARL